MNKKQRLIILLCALVVLLGAYYGVVSSAEKAEQKAEEAALAETELLLSEAVTDIVGVAFTSQEGSEVALTLTDGVWSLTGDDTFDVDETILDSMVSDLTGIEIETVLTEVEDCSEYGLDRPVNQITVTKTDGSAVQILIGNENPTTSMYYVCLDNVTDTVYCISTDLASTFDMSLEDMRCVEEETADTDS